MRVGVVGLGTMGAGITQVCLEAGLAVTGCELDAEGCERGRAAIARGLERRVERGRLTAAEREETLARLTTSTVLGDLAGSDVVVEAVVEELGAKVAVFRALDDVLAAEAIVATNTSALPVTAIAAASARPERVVGLHFFNPAPVLPLVEVVETELAAAQTVERAVAFVERLGKEPVRCRDTPGFLVNRLLIPLLNDAVRGLDETGVPAEDVDRALRLGAGWPIGPLALIDLIGVDVHVHASEALWDALRDPRVAPPPRLVRMRDAGRLGRKTGEGFHRYDGASRD